MTTPKTPQERSEGSEEDEQLVTGTPRTPAPRTSEHDELLRPNPPFPGDAPD
jgi:hypothetical protein